MAEPLSDLRDTTSHFCAGCGRVGCVAEWKQKAYDAADEIRQWREAVELMVCEIDGIQVGYDNGCKGAALMVGERMLGVDQAASDEQGQA